MSTSAVLIIIATLAGLLTLWRDEIVTPKKVIKSDETDDEKSKRLIDELKQEKTKRVKLISSIFILLTLLFTLYQIHATNVSSKVQHDKDSLAYKQLDSTYKNSIANGIAVNNIKQASQSILDSLDTVRLKIDAYSHEQIAKLKDITSQTVDLLNPIPDHIVVRWAGKFRINHYTAEDWSKGLNDKMKSSPFPNYFQINDTFLYKTSGFLDRFTPFNDMQVEFKSGKVSVLFSGSLTNYYLPIGAYEQEVNDNSREFTNILYDSIGKTIEFSGIVKLKINDISQTVKSLKAIEKCSIVIRSEFIELYVRPAFNELNFTATINNKFNFEVSHIKYDEREKGYKTNALNILTKPN